MEADEFRPLLKSTTQQIYNILYAMLLVARSIRSCWQTPVILGRLTNVVVHMHSWVNTWYCDLGR